MNLNLISKVEGYYADPEADCQAFHICASDGHSGLTKYSFLCPNGTIFKQQAMEFIIDHMKFISDYLKLYVLIKDSKLG